MEDLQENHCQVRRKVQGANIQDLAIPKIGSGLDGFEWGRTMKVLQSVFLNSPTKLTVIYLSDKEEKTFRSSVRSRRLNSSTTQAFPKIELLGDSQVRGVGLLLNSISKSTCNFVTCMPES